MFGPHNTYHSALRADRLATLYLFHPLFQMRRPEEKRASILMYHSISSENEGVHPYFQTTTSLQTFIEHMRFLHENGYAATGLNDVATHIERSVGPERKVVITFDDGYRDFYTDAIPVLKHYGFTATMFLPTKYIGKTVRQFKSRNCLTWSEVRELHKAGFSFGSHTVTHPQLRCITQEQQEFELRYSKETIEDQIGAPVHSFSYPYAFPEQDHPFTKHIRHLLKQMGYRNGVSTVIGTLGLGADTFFLKRLPINSCDDLCFFKAKVEGAYDWLHWAQYSAKRLRARIS